MTTVGRQSALWRSLLHASLIAGLVGAACGAQAAPLAEPVVLVGGPQYPLFDHSVTGTDIGFIVVGGAGGDMNDGLLVDDPLLWAADGAFRSIASPPGPARNRHGAVWVDEELIIWSGSSKPGGVGDGILTSGAAYDPSTDRWRVIADAPKER